MVSQTITRPRSRFRHELVQTSSILATIFPMMIDNAAMSYSIALLCIGYDLELAPLRRYLALQWLASSLCGQLYLGEVVVNVPILLLQRLPSLGGSRLASICKFLIRNFCDRLTTTEGVDHIHGFGDIFAPALPPYKPHMVWF